MSFGFPPSDTDVDECILAILGQLADHALVDEEYVESKLHDMVNGDMTHKLFMDRMFALICAKRIIAEKAKPKGKTRPISMYRLRLDSDNERPTWTTSRPSSSS
jgi:hypothetical protein